MKFYIMIALAIIAGTAKGAKILVVYNMPSKSHSLLGEGFVRHLTKAGHEVTFITPFPNPKLRDNVIQINISEVINNLPADMIRIDTLLKEQRPMDNAIILMISNTLMEAALKHQAVENMMLDPNIKFDAVISEWFFGDLYSGWGAFYQCPLIWAGTTDVHAQVLMAVDEAPNPAYTADISSTNKPPFTMYQRATELYEQVKKILLIRFKFYPMETEQYEKYFISRAAKKGLTLPPYEKVVKNGSILLINSHPSIGAPVRLPANTKYIGGFHIETPTKPLPEDFQKIMDNSKNGVILFSMGSNLKSQHFPDEMKKEFLNVFGELKETVLWKFEETLPNAPKNVIMKNWMPQPSLLAHPNLKVFITHGGFLSTTESIHYGVPLIGIPVFGDQFVNMNMAVRKGFALRLKLALDLPQQLRVALKEMLTNSNYKKKAKELSSIFHDRPTPPAQEAVHWVEHAIKTKGAMYLRSPALDVPLYQKLYLDLAIIIISCLLITISLIKKCCNSICSKKSEKMKKN